MVSVFFFTFHQRSESYIPGIYYESLTLLVIVSYRWYTTKNVTNTSAVLVYLVPVYGNELSS